MVIIVDHRETIKKFLYGFFSLELFILCGTLSSPRRSKLIFAQNYWKYQCISYLLVVTLKKLSILHCHIGAYKDNFFLGESKWTNQFFNFKWQMVALMDRRPYNFALKIQRETPPQLLLMKVRNTSGFLAAWMYVSSLLLLLSLSSV